MVESFVDQAVLVQVRFGPGGVVHAYGVYL